MQLNLIDKSNYLRAMLLLSGKDKKISSSERNFINVLGEKLGFEKSFTRQAVSSLFDNEYIKHEPPVFSNSQIAKSFILDGIKLIVTDPKLNQQEIDWLVKVAKANGLDESFIYDEIKKIRNNELPETEQLSLEVENYL